MRLSREKKVAGSLGAAVLAAAGLAGLGAPSANAEDDPISLACTSAFGNFNYDDVFTLTVSDLTPDAGDTVDATLVATTGPPFGAPPAVVVGPGGYEPTVTLQLDGTTPVVLTSTDQYPATAVAGGSNFGGYEVGGSFTGGDPTTLTLQSVEFGDAEAGGFLCTPTSGALVPVGPTDTGEPTGDVTVTVTQTVTEPGSPGATVTETATETVPGPETTVTETVPGPETTVTETVTEPGSPGATVTETVPGPETTVTETEAGPTVTVTEAGPTVTVTSRPDECDKPGYGHPHSKHHKKKGKGHKKHGHGYGYGHGKNHRYGYSNAGYRGGDGGWNGGDDRYGHPHSVHHRGYDRAGYGHHHDGCDDNGTDTVAFAGATDIGGGTSGGGGPATVLALGAAVLVGAVYLGVGASRRPRGQHS